MELRPVEEVDRTEDVMNTKARDLGCPRHQNGRNIEHMISGDFRHYL